VIVEDARYSVRRSIYEPPVISCVFKRTIYEELRRELPEPHTDETAGHRDQLRVRAKLNENVFAYADERFRICYYIDLLTFEV
jgi:hypothetical protein